MTAIILLVGVFLLSGCFFSSKHEVTFKTNGGSEVKNASVKSGNKLEVPETPTKEGYVFEGWYLNGKEYNFDEEVNEDITLVAKWRKVDVDGEENQDDKNNDDKVTPDDNDENEEPTTKRVTTKKTTVSGTVKKTTKKSTTKSTTKKTTTSTTTKKVENPENPEKPTKPSVPEEPTKPTEPSVPEEPITPTPEEPSVPEEPVVPEKKELKMNITITEEVINAIKVEATYTNTLEVIKPKEDLKEEISEDTKKKYNVVIDLDSEEVNTVSRLSDEDLIEFLNSDVSKWQINDQMGKIFELEIKDNKITTSAESEIRALTIMVADKGYVLTFDEEMQKWILDYPTVKVTNEEKVMYYASLEDAIKTVVSKDKVTILKDMENQDTIVIDKAISIDGGSFKLSSTSEYLFDIKNINDEENEIVISNMEVKVKSLLRVEDLKVKSITIENIKGSYENKIMDNQSWLEIIENNLKLDFLEIKEEKINEEKTL